MTNFQRAEQDITYESNCAQRYAMAQVECGAWDADYAGAWLSNRLQHLQADWNDLHEPLKSES